MILANAACTLIIKLKRKRIHDKKYTLYVRGMSSWEKAMPLLLTSKVKKGGAPETKYQTEEDASPPQPAAGIPCLANTTVVLGGFKDLTRMFVNDPALSTLRAAFQALGAKVVCATSAISLKGRSTTLHRNDVIILIGMDMSYTKASSVIPWGELGKRGVLRVYYK